MSQFLITILKYDIKYSLYILYCNYIMLTNKISSDRNKGYFEPIE